jgi:hypothetical protein
MRAGRSSASNDGISAWNARRKRSEFERRRAHAALDELEGSRATKAMAAPCACSTITTRNADTQPRAECREMLAPTRTVSQDYGRCRR